MKVLPKGKMARVSKGLSSVALLAVVSASATTVWAADESMPAADGQKVLVTEFRGRPPFNREFLNRDEVAELARFEETARDIPAEGMRVADFRGRPPYKREFLSADELAELARFEETSATDDQLRTRRGPPGKMNSRR